MPLHGRRIRVGTLADFPPRRILTIEINAQPICLVNAMGTIYAVQGRCPHNGASLSNGIIDGTSLLCPQHYWSFNLGNGKLNRPPVDACLHTYPLISEGEDVFIEVEAVEREQE